MGSELKNSTEDQTVLRAAALWAADYAAQALPLFEHLYPADLRPRRAVEAGCEFGRGRKRDKNLRVLALAAFKLGQGLDVPAKYATRAASLTAAIAYTHTDLQTGIQGVRQAQHILGPIVYAALALETAAGGEPAIGAEIIRRAIVSAPPEVHSIVQQLPPQPAGTSRLAALLADLDAGLRT